MAGLKQSLKRREVNGKIYLENKSLKILFIIEIIFRQVWVELNIWFG